MSVVILSCGEQEARDIFNKWLQEPAHYITCDVEYEISPVQSGEQERTWLSVRCKPKQTARTRATALMGGCLLLSLLLIALMPPFYYTWVGGLIHSAPILLPISCFLGFSLLFLIVCLSPEYTLGRLSRLCKRESNYAVASFTLAGVHYNVLDPGDSYTWFRDETEIIIGAILVLAGIRMLAAFDGWGLLQVAAPLLLFLPIVLIHVYLRTIVYGQLRDPSHLPLFWKIKATDLVSINDAFLPLLLLCAILLVVGRTTLFIALYAWNLHNFSLSTALSHLYAFDIFSPFTNSPNGFSAYFLATLTAYASPYSRLATYLEVAAAGAVVLGFFRGTISVFNQKKWELFEWEPGELPKDIVSRGTNPIVHSALLLEWLLEGVVRVFGLIVGIIILLTIFNVPPAWLPWQWLIPLLWFRVAMQLILGTLAGSIIADTLLLLAITPLLLWFLLWLISIIRACKQSLGLVFSRNKESGVVQTATNDLCKTLHISRPIIRLTKERATWPATSFLLPSPRFSIIRTPTNLVERLTENRLSQKQLRLVLAHELGHVTKHAWRIWRLQLLSFLSLTGPGYLTLFLDYWGIEMEADVFAVQVTGDGLELITLLEKEIVNTQAVKRPAQEVNNNTHRLKRLYSRLMQYAWIAQIRKTYNIHFGDILWGAFHPTIKERINNLYDFVFEKENLGSLDRFTEQAKEVIERAKAEAKHFQNDGIRTEHLLLALLHDDFAIKMLRQVSNNPDLVPHDLERFMGRGKDPVPDTIDYMPFTKRVLVRAAHEASAQNRQSIGQDHLLLEIIEEPGSLAVKMLEKLNVDLAMLRIAILEEMKGLTEQAKGVLTLAREEAKYRQHNYVGTEHLLLGLVHESESTAAKVLSTLGVKLGTVRSAIEFIIGQGNHPVEGKIDLAPRAWKVMRLASDEARCLNHSFVGTEHILLGIVREGECIAAGVLESLVGDLEKVREATLAIMRQGQQEVLQPQAIQGTEETQRMASHLSEEGPTTNLHNNILDGGVSDDLLTEQARGVIEYAKEEAAYFQHNHIGTEHLLLGLLHSSDSKAGQVLKQFGIKIETVRSSVEFINGCGEKPSPPTLPLTQYGNRVIELAVEEAKSLGSSFVDTEHILLGILKEDEGIAAGILQALGVDPGKMREATLAALGKKETEDIAISDASNAADTHTDRESMQR